MKVYSISLLSVNQAASPPQATALGGAQDLSSFSFYQRGSVGEFMTFFTKVNYKINNGANGRLLLNEHLPTNLLRSRRTTTKLMSSVLLDVQVDLVLPVCPPHYPSLTC
jgi:hypothetical protein